MSLWERNNVASTCHLIELRFTIQSGFLVITLNLLSTQLRNFEDFCLAKRRKRFSIAIMLLSTILLILNLFPHLRIVLFLNFSLRVGLRITTISGLVCVDFSNGSSKVSLSLNKPVWGKFHHHFTYGASLQFRMVK